MNLIGKLILTSTGVLLLGVSPAFAQSDADDEADVWATIEAQWDAEAKGDKKWANRLLTDDFSGWGKNSPAPRSKTSIIMWDRFYAGQGKTIAHELYPLDIRVHGDVAIAHYLYTSAFQNKDDTVEVDNGRFTDVLVRTEDGWKFIAWHGGDDD
ncbi:MAG: nuclear transport factor 2 family protein [Proteobacteria bacterium]|nr:nuclear transport factor 2 family protein [Pseudomonadota bacterium]